MQQAGDRNRTLIVHDPLCRRHDPGPRHPEQPARYDAAMAGAAAALESGAARERAPRPATFDDIQRCHPRSYIDIVRADVADGYGTLRTGDTDVCEHSLEAALGAAGCLLTAVDAVAAGEAANAFCPVRPPGHHASAERGMGFCIFNNIALAARHAQQQHGMERILVVDWDVHHGNGTQALFLEDPSVLYFSVHQWPLYPGTGLAGETGRGPGAGRTINCPLGAGSCGRDVMDKFRARLAPATRAFRPDLVLISAGFDAWRGDPVGSLDLTAADYGRLTDLVLDLAHDTAGGRVVSALEGGYDLQGLTDCVRAHVASLAGGR
jgi:acetoin utilization deacetylase AcuC-like enzyme